MAFLSLALLPRILFLHSDMIKELFTNCINFSLFNELSTALSFFNSNVHADACLNDLILSFGFDSIYASFETLKPQIKFVNSFRAE